ncbi:MAG TPA: VTT domain-containing protein [Stellaceae bacterium]|nr:VTT domain-containing protein [Stellaceae bacterium]
MTPEPVRLPLPILRQAGRVVALLAIVLGIVALATHREMYDPAAVAATIGQYPAAPLVFVAVHVVASLIFFPRTLLGVAAGALFGAWWGTFWAALGSVIGALAGFLLARYVNSGLIDLESTPRLGPVLLRAERGGWRSVAALRLIPVVPHSLANYALGLTRLGIGSYALGSFLGQLPMTIAATELGAAGESALTGRTDWLLPTLIGAAALTASFILPRLVQRHR